ncbi:hypothetical protein SAMN04488009_1892 [Maribacter sedimenticola]|uniref:Uncharacterized protein n=1 Tax=Maribacter sedimenticola TaxID=228956 RepID=A0ABY1SHE9_9FLAO|nr:hypothetical protein SAMN04488009_1892 [Maribacter sedimenticola]
MVKTALIYVYSIGIILVFIKEINLNTNSKTRFRKLISSK